MSRPKSIIPVTCQNRQCKYYLKKEIIKYGKNRAQHQLYQRFHCNHFFSETKLTPIYLKHLCEGDITKICKLLVEKNGIRSIERITGHHRETMQPARRPS